MLCHKQWWIQEGLKSFACFFFSFLFFSPNGNILGHSCSQSQMCWRTDPVSCFFTPHLPCGGWASQAWVNNASGLSASWPGGPWRIAVLSTAFQVRRPLHRILKRLWKGFLSFLITCIETLNKCLTKHYPLWRFCGRPCCLDPWSFVNNLRVVKYKQWVRIWREGCQSFIKAETTQSI